MQGPNRIPLFPLDVVLLPGAQLPLHIFEPRYKVMISRCLSEKLEFGMILAAEKAVASVGCTAEIIRTIREYPDGLIDILTQGRTDFQLKQLLDEKEYYEGIVDYLTDGPWTPDPDQETKLVQTFEKCHSLLFGQAWADAAPTDPATLAYRMAALVPMELEKRQQLLEMRSRNDRRAMILRWLEEFLPKLEERQRSRHRAGGNGHSLN
jgi:Lon protease-like protein